MMTQDFPQPRQNSYSLSRAHTAFKNLSGSEPLHPSADVIHVLCLRIENEFPGIQVYFFHEEVNGRVIPYAYMSECKFFVDEACRIFTVDPAENGEVVQYSNTREWRSKMIQAVLGSKASPFWAISIPESVDKVGDYLVLPTGGKVTVEEDSIFLCGMQVSEDSLISLFQSAVELQ